ncbi:hypothetical protein COV82_02330 [Candidatus Peregrinibacteria bacterium CG11_big_fil_rev_8_21_14_0_20_46_8]|nr:MAG: hypothetical protein COV82_02330 [Candidatus Peregrinibacteria bacterium CG11_big_fil_rev_8_21_14_0_20_46_8]
MKIPNKLSAAPVLTAAALTLSGPGCTSEERTMQLKIQQSLAAAIAKIPEGEELNTCRREKRSDLDCTREGFRSHMDVYDQPNDALQVSSNQTLGEYRIDPSLGGLFRLRRSVSMNYALNSKGDLTPNTLFIDNTQVGDQHTKIFCEKGDSTRPNEEYICTEKKINNERVRPGVAIQERDLARLMRPYATRVAQVMNSTAAADRLQKGRSSQRGR